MLSNKISEYTKYNYDDDDITTYNRNFDNEFVKFLEDSEQKMDLYSYEKNDSQILHEISFRDSLMNLIVNGGKWNLKESEVNLKYDNLYTKSAIINLRGSMDAIENIYLEITLPENETFDDLEIDEKYKLFNISISIQVDTNTIIEISLLTSLFMTISRGLNIKSNNNILQIPILDFNLQKLTRCNSDWYDANGFIVYVHKEIYLYIHNDLADNPKFKFNFFIKGKLFDSPKRRHFAERLIYTPIFTSISGISNDNIYVETYNPKMIILYFEPKTEYVEYPRISYINLKYNDTNKNYSCSDLLEMTIFDITLYILPLSHDFSNWTNIHKALKDPYNNLSTDEQKSNLYLNIEYELISQTFLLHYECFSLYTLIAKTQISK